MHAIETRPDATVASTPGPSRTVKPVLRWRPHRRGLGPLAAVVMLMLFAGLICTACGSGITLGGKPPLPTPAPTANLAHTNWTLTRLIVDLREQQLVPGHAPTLYFGPLAGEFSGTDGCNGYDDTTPTRLPGMRST